MRLQVTLIAALIFGCAHNAPDTLHPTSLRDVVAAAEAFDDKEITVIGYWVQIGKSASLIDMTCPIQTESLPIVLSPGVLQNLAAVRTIRSMSRHSGMHAEPHVTVITINAQIAEFVGRGTFEYTKCAPALRQTTPDYDLSVPATPGCIPYRMTVSEIRSLNPVALESMPECFRRESK